MKAEVVVFNGVQFRRYPDSKRWADRVYFTPGVADRQRGVKRLHEEIWIAHHGPIPDGHHVHHVDHNPLNNSPDNLVALSGIEHARHHSTSEDAQARMHSPEWLNQLAEIRPLAAAWHGSPEGLAWHRRHGRLSWEGREASEATCEQCGARYESLTPRRFCSNACKSAWRRAAGLDNETRSCEHCSAVFTTNHYSRVRYCSRSCATKARHAREASTTT